MSLVRILFFSALAILGVIFGVYSGISSFRQIEYRRVEINRATVIAEVAADIETRRLGLVDKKSIAPNYGMLFMFAKPDYHGLWMKGMKFPVDVIWIKNSRVVDLEENILPSVVTQADNVLPVYKPDALASMALEVKAGFARRNSVKIGDEIKISPCAMQGGWLADRISAPNYLSTESSFRIMPGSEFFMETLRQKSAQGKDFKIEKELERNKAYQKFLISYQSGDLKINGSMSVPSDEIPTGGFPVLILNRDFSDLGAEKIQDFFAGRGYITVSPDYLGSDSSGPASPLTEYDFYVGYTQDVINLLDALKKLPPDLDKKLNIEKIGVWGQGVGGLVASRLMVLRPEIKAYVLFASLIVGTEDNFYPVRSQSPEATAVPLPAGRASNGVYELPEKERARLAEIYGPETKEIYKEISPFIYFAEVSGPVQLHHGVLDIDAPIIFSEKIFLELSKNNKRAEFFRYSGEGHEFGHSWRLAAERSLDFFNHYVAEAK